MNRILPQVPRHCHPRTVQSDRRHCKSTKEANKLSLIKNHGHAHWEYLTAMHSLLVWHWNWNLPHVDDFITVCVLVISANRIPNGGIVEVVIAALKTSDADDCLKVTLKYFIANMSRVTYEWYAGAGLFKFTNSNSFCDNLGFDAWLVNACWSSVRVTVRIPLV